MKLLWKLLRAHISVTQFAGFFITNLIGLTIVLAGIQFKEDLKPFFAQGDSFLKDDYIVVSKKVSALGSLVGSTGGFSDKEIQNIEEQPFVKTTGKFEAARFRISGGLKMPGTNLSFQTYMFFEAVPDRFLDIKVDEWKFNENTGEIPIIIPRSYLNLYNFGFAASRSMPKLSEGMIKMLRLDIFINGNGQRAEYKGKVVGFSNRLNTILVPASFLTWANSEYGAKENEEPVRIIMEVTNSSDEKLASYLSSKGYETEGNMLNSGKLAYFMRIIIFMVLGVGVLICLLSFFILILSIYLLLQKNSDKLKNLMLIGYSGFRVSFFYILFAVSLNLIATALSVSLVAWLRKLYIAIFSEMLPDINFSGISIILLYAFILFIIISLTDLFIILGKVKGIRNNK